MEQLWFRYEKEQIWPGERFENERAEVEPRSKLDQIYAWEDYAAREFNKWVSEVTVP